MAKEIWKKIKGYGGKYEISSLGRIKSLWWGKERILVLNKNTTKIYLDLQLCFNGEQKQFTVHRLVAMSFLPKQKGKNYVNHKNGDKKDNRVENLEWCTNGENQKHAYSTKLRVSQKGEEHGQAKLSKKDVLEIRNIYKNGNISQRPLAKMFNVSQMLVSLIVRKLSWKHI